MIKESIYFTPLAILKFLIHYCIIKLMQIMYSYKHTFFNDNKLELRE
jgi:hypothetical protein